MSELEDLRKAHLQAHEQLQKLYLLLGEKGVISDDELRYVTGEGPKPRDPGLGVTSRDW